MNDTSVKHVCSTCGKVFYTERGAEYAYTLPQSGTKNPYFFCSWSCMRAKEQKETAKTGCRGNGNPWRIKYFEGDKLVAIGTATELAKLTGKASGTIRIYALRKQRFRTGQLFEYEDAYYEYKKDGSVQEECKEWDGVSDRTIRDMARESARRRMSYGALQTEEYFVKHPSNIKVPTGYTSMRDGEEQSEQK